MKSQHALKSPKHSVKLIALLFILLFFGNFGTTRSSAPTLDQTGNFVLFMQIDGIAGSSVDSVHKDWSDILSYEWGVLSSGGTHVGAGTTAPRTVVSDFFVTKNLDKASPLIMQAALQHTSIKKVTIEVARYGGSGKYVAFNKFVLENCFVSSYYQTGSQTSLFESLSFAFQKLTYSYTPQNPDGSYGGTIEVVYDLTKP